MAMVRLAAALGYSALLVCLSLPPVHACTGDCSGDRQITIEELVRGVGVVLGTLAIGVCRAADRDGDGRVTIDEVVAAVRAALEGCPPDPPTPTAPPTATPSAAAWTFTDVTAAAGLDYQHGYADPLYYAENGLTAGGVAAGDFDGDGWVDLYAVGGDHGANLLLRNRGDGSFENVAPRAGVAVEGRRGSGPTFADVDGDGRLDLLVLGIDDSLPILFRNRGDGTFADVTVASGLTVDRDSFSSAFGDYDRDGDLDLFIAHWSAQVSPGETTQSLWRNDGGAVFVDVSVASGVSAAIIAMLFPGEPFAFDFTFTPNFADIDADGWLDLLLASDFGNSRVLINNRDGTFANRTTAVISDENGMGGAVGDYDNDGDLDWFVSSVFDPNRVSEGFWGVSGNRLYRNDGMGHFADVTDAAGVRDGGWGWGSTFADLNNDGWLDLFHVNGWRAFEEPIADEFAHDAARLFVNRSDGTFAERAAELGAADTAQGRGVVAFDYDRDGDLDLFIANNGGPPRLLRNDGGNAANHLGVVLRGPPPNTQAIGARITVTAGGRTQLRELRAGSNFVSQDPSEAHFGLGDATVVDELRVVWPNGTETIQRDVAVNQMVTITAE
jgi:hypothetical protein